MSSQKILGIVLTLVGVAATVVAVVVLFLPVHSSGGYICGSAIKPDIFNEDGCSAALAGRAPMCWTIVVLGVLVAIVGAVLWSRDNSSAKASPTAV